jgi:hypothetical protein
MGAISAAADAAVRACKRRLLEDGAQSTVSRLLPGIPFHRYPVALANSPSNYHAARERQPANKTSLIDVTKKIGTDPIFRYVENRV